MSMSDRVKALQLPLDEVVVIGSGLLDQLGLRAANDVDLVVSERLFTQLDADKRFTRQTDERGVFYTAPKIEVWSDWGSETHEQLRAEAQQLDGVWYVAPDYLIQKKQARGTEKDLNDVKKLEEYNERGRA